MERIRLDKTNMTAAKAALATAETQLDLSGNRLAKLLHVSARTWRSYKDPLQPGPPADVIRRLDDLLAADDQAQAGALSALWGLEPNEPRYEGPGDEAPQRETSDRPALMPVTRRRRLIILSFGAVVAVAAITVIILLASRSTPDEMPTVQLTAYNKVVADETRMREDVPGYLTTSPNCLAKSTCGVPGTDHIVTGTELLAICEIEGMLVTNRFGDVVNPENFDSTRWYGVELDGTFGYFPEVWIAQSDRGRHNLRTCEPSG